MTRDTFRDIIKRLLEAKKADDRLTEANDDKI